MTTEQQLDPADTNPRFFTDATEYDTLIPDVSEFYPYLNMAAVRTMNGGAVIIRMHNGYRADYSGTTQRANAHNHGLSVIGLYQYIVPEVDILQQAEEFIAVVGQVEPGEFVVMCYESGQDGVDHVSRANTWLSAVMSAMPGVPVLIQSDVDFVQHFNLGPVFTNLNGWITDYSQYEPRIPHLLWQCTDGTHGINITEWPGAGRCCTSVFRGTLSELKEDLFGHPAEDTKVSVVTRFKAKFARNPRRAPIESKVATGAVGGSLVMGLLWLLVTYVFKNWAHPLANALTGGGGIAGYFTTAYFVKHTPRLGDVLNAVLDQLGQHGRDLNTAGVNAPSEGSTANVPVPIAQQVWAEEPPQEEPALVAAPTQVISPFDLGQGTVQKDEFGA